MTWGARWDGGYTTPKIISTNQAAVEDARTALTDALESFLATFTTANTPFHCERLGLPCPAAWWLVKP